MVLVLMNLSILIKIGQMVDLILILKISLTIALIFSDFGRQEHLIETK